MGRESLTEMMRFQQKPEGNERGSKKVFWEKDVSGRGNRKSRGPKAIAVIQSGRSKKARMLEPNQRRP